MINVVIPMAGEGARFKKEGYKRAKPFIEFEGKTMVEHVLEGLECADASYTLVIRRSFLDEYKSELDFLSGRYNVRFSVVDGCTVGALATALSAFECLDAKSHVVFADSDNIFSAGVFKNFVRDALSRKLDASLLTFKSSDERFSYVRVDDGGFALETREKEPISSHAIAGAYMFSSGALFVKCAILTLIYPPDRNEYFMSGAYNTLIRLGCKCGIFEIAESDFACTGTPQQLRAYLDSKSGAL